MCGRRGDVRTSFPHWSIMRTTRRYLIRSSVVKDAFVGVALGCSNDINTFGVGVVQPLTDTSSRCLSAAYEFHVNLDRGD